MSLEICKLDEQRNLVFGFASVAVTEDGRPLEDTQEDIIPPNELEDMAYELVLTSRAADAMHSEKTIGQLVESIVFTPEKLKALGLPEDAIQPRWWVGFRVKPDIFAKVKAGEYQWFSIGATADRIPASEDV